VLLLISHDRALLDDVCDRLVVLDGEGNARVFEGSYREWEEKERALRAEEAQRARKPQSPPKPAQPQAPKPQAAAAPAKPAKGRFSNLPIERIESRIADIGRELMQIDADFANPKTASDSAKMKKLLTRREELQKEQSELEEEWLRKSG
jgi:ATP-binding cassette subfamily F protein uup